MPWVGLGFEPDADDEDEDHLIKPLIAHVYNTSSHSRKIILIAASRRAFDRETMRLRGQ
jgi:hypothetical protein